MTELQQQLFSMADAQYKAFHAKLIPTVSPAHIIGIRTPQLRRFAREFAKAPAADAFLRQLPHVYYEENNLHAFLLECIRDFDLLMAETERFLPYVDNWATCDMFSPKLFRKYPDAVYGKIKQWLGSAQVYTVRFAIVRLMSDFLGEAFLPEMPALVCAVQSEEYYINMAAAWYFATALAGHYEIILPYLTEHRLGLWVHNKTIQKAVESRRITPEQKAQLRSLRRKTKSQAQPERTE